MKDIAIFGSGGLGQETAASLSKLTFSNPEGWNFIGFFDDTIPIGTEISHLGKVLGGIKELNEWPEPINIAIGLGYPKDRWKVRCLITNQLVSFPNLIHKNLYVSDLETFEIGEGNLIQGGCCFTTQSTIGNFNLLNGNVCFGHHESVGNFNVFMPGTTISGRVSIGDKNLFGAGAYIMEKLRIGCEVTVGPLSALLTKPKDGNTYIGNPAKRFRFD